MTFKPRVNEAPIKVIGVGLRRTGVSPSCIFDKLLMTSFVSLDHLDAQQLGFGPVYDMKEVFRSGGRDC